MPDYHEIKEVQITIAFTDALGSIQSNNFNTVQELADFLKDHPKVAEAVKYIPK